MITEYYEFLLNCVDKGFDEHHIYITGMIISLLVFIVISAFVVQYEKNFTTFVTAVASIMFSLIWPIIIYILAGIVLPLALLIGVIYGLSKLINCMSKLIIYTKKLGLNNKEKKTC